MTRPPRVARLVRPHIPSLAPYVGVAPPEVRARELGIAPERLIKLDANENPYGPSPLVAQALADVATRVNRYPDPRQDEVRSALAAYASVDAEQVVAGAGCDELIDLLVRIAVAPGDQLIDLPPTFGMYRVTAGIADGEVVAVPRDEQFDVDVAAVRRAVGPRTRIIFLCNPNNPTGTLSPESTVRELLELGPLVVVDETYHEFCGFTVAPLVAEYEHLLVLRSFSKWAGLAGLRIGYGIMSPTLAGYMMAAKTPYNVSVAAQAALFASLEDTDLLLQRVRLLVEERERMKAMLEGLPGVRCSSTKANFVLCRFPAGQGARVHGALADRGIIVRAFDDPRLADCLRVTAGTPEHTDALMAALTEALG